MPTAIDGHFANSDSSPVPAPGSCGDDQDFASVGFVLSDDKIDPAPNAKSGIELDLARTVFLRLLHRAAHEDEYGFPVPRRRQSSLAFAIIIGDALHRFPAYNQNRADQWARFDIDLNRDSIDKIVTSPHEGDLVDESLDHVRNQLRTGARAFLTGRKRPFLGKKLCFLMSRAKSASRQSWDLAQLDKPASRYEQWLFPLTLLQKNDYIIYCRIVRKEIHAIERSVNDAAAKLQGKPALEQLSWIMQIMKLAPDALSNTAISALNRYLESAPQDTLEQKQHLCEFINYFLQQTNAVALSPKTRQPSEIRVFFDVKHPNGRFVFRFPGSSASERVASLRTLEVQFNFLPPIQLPPAAAREKI